MRDVRGKKDPSSTGGICLKFTQTILIPFSFTGAFNAGASSGEAGTDGPGGRCIYLKGHGCEVEREVQMGKIHRGFEVCVCPKPMFSLNEEEEMII